MKIKKKTALIAGILAVLALMTVGWTVIRQQREKTEAVTLSVRSGVENRLNRYPNLKMADLSGSICYDEILAYEAEHPEVQVIYTISTGSQTISNHDTEVNVEDDELEVLTEDGPYLQNLKRITIGVTEADSETLKALTAAYPDAVIDYTIQLGGSSLSSAENTADLSVCSCTASEAQAALEKLPGVTEVILSDEDGNSPFTFEDYIQLSEALPDKMFTYRFMLYDTLISTKDETIAFKKKDIGNDGIEEIRKLLPYMPVLTKLSVDRCGVDNEVMAQLRDDFPQISVVWRVFFGDYSCMTDAEKIWAIGQLNDENSTALQYCTAIKYIDIGHNALTDVSFLANMPDLEVCIIALNPLSDISPLASCKKLEYLELTCTNVSDISVLAECTSLKHLEISQLPQLTDISPVYGLNLERFHAMYDRNIPAEQKAEFIELHPDCDVDFSTDWLEDPFNESNWRFDAHDGQVYADRYALLRQQIGYDDPYGKTLLYSFEDEDDPDYVYTGAYITEDSGN